MSMKIDLEVLSSFDFIITAIVSVCESEYEESDVVYRQILMSIILCGNQ